MESRERNIKKNNVLESRRDVEKEEEINKRVKECIKAGWCTERGAPLSF